MFESIWRCHHPKITIVGIRDDLSAVYVCDECGRVVKPSQMDKTYKPDNTG